MSKTVISYMKLVKPEDLNPANRLFGGQMMKWIDEAAALYVMSTMKTKNIVTVTVSNLTFDKPVMNGAFLEFHCRVAAVGTTSITIFVDVQNKDVAAGTGESVVTCSIKFVNLNSFGRPSAHSLTMEDLA